MKKPDEEPSVVDLLLPTVANIVPYYRSNRSARKNTPPIFYSASMSTIIDMLWLYCAAGGWGQVLQAWAHPVTH